MTWRRSTGIHERCSKPPRENSADNIRYRAVDITNRGDLQLGTFDLVFCALTIHHMASPEAILARLWGMIRPSGALIIRTPDDGLKLTYPDQDKGMERLISVSSALLGSSDRFHGRKAMGQLQSLLPQPVKVEMKGQVTSTAGYGSGEREDFFADHYGYRADNASKLAQSGDATAEMKAAAEQLQRAVSDMRTRFVLDDNVFSTSTDLAFVAVKGSAELTDVWSSS